jgi:hypothetical protein
MTLALAWLAISMQENQAIEITTVDIASETIPHQSPTLPQRPLADTPQQDEQHQIQSGQEHPTTPIERIRQITEKSDLHIALLEDHDKYTRYPPENRRFHNEQQDPISQRYAIDERTTLNEDQTYGMTVWSDKKFYLQSDQVHIFALITDGEGKNQKANLESTVFFNNSKLDTLTLEPTYNGSYSAILDLSSKSTKLTQTGIYKVIIKDSTHNILDAVTFTLSKPDISLTGEFRDNINSSGDLLIEAEVDVSTTNRFYVQASLYSSTGVPVGVTEGSHQLEIGTHWIPLSYSGKMIQDSQESGPYILKKVSLAKVTMPMQRAPMDTPNYQTDAYALDEFVK